MHTKAESRTAASTHTNVPRHIHAASRGPDRGVSTSPRVLVAVRPVRCRHLALAVRGCSLARSPAVSQRSTKASLVDRQGQGEDVQRKRRSPWAAHVKKVGKAWNHCPHCHTHTHIVRNLIIHTVWTSQTSSISSVAWTEIHEPSVSFRLSKSQPTVDLTLGFCSMMRKRSGRNGFGVSSTVSRSQVHCYFGGSSGGKKGIFNDKWPDRRSCRAPAIHQTADCQWTSVCCDAERLACTRTKWIMIGGTRIPGRATATSGNGPGAFVAQPSACLWMRQMATAWQLQNVYSCDHKPTRLSNKAGKWIISRPLFKALVFVWWGLPWKWNLDVLYPHVSTFKDVAKQSCMSCCMTCLLMVSYDYALHTSSYVAKILNLSLFCFVLFFEWRICLF